MTCSPVRLPSGRRKASGTVPMTSNPSDRHSAVARTLVSTTALNWIERKPLSVAHRITRSPSARPIPRPARAGSTMKLALATWEPAPGRFA